MDGVQVKKTYKVTGTQPVLDTKPGGTFEADMPPDREKFLIAIGGIEIVKDKPKEPKATKSADRD